MKIAFSLPDLQAETTIQIAEFETVHELKKNLEITLIPYGKFSELRPILLLKYVFQARDSLVNGNYDVIHINTAYDFKALFRDLFFLSLIRKRYTGKIFLKFHGSDSNIYKKRRYHYLTKKVIKYVDGIGFLSSDELNDFDTYFGNRKKFYIVKNSMIMHPSQYDRGDNVLRLLFVGRLIQSKGISDLLYAFEQLIHKENIKDIRLDVVGGGPLLNKLEDEYSNGNIRIHGKVAEAEVLNFFSKCDVLILPTYHQEGLPQVILKALAFGKSIITTKIRGMKDYLTEDNCIFVPAKSPEKLSEAIKKLYNDSSLREKIKIKNLELAKTFLPEKVAKEYEEIYLSLLK